MRDYMTLQDCDIHFTNRSQTTAAAYHWTGRLEIYYDDFTVAKRCDIHAAKAICLSVGIPWTTVTEIYSILEQELESSLIL